MKERRKLQTPTCLLFHGAIEIDFRPPLEPKIKSIYHETVRNNIRAPSISAHKTKKSKGSKDGDLQEKQMRRAMKLRLLL